MYFVSKNFIISKDTWYGIKLFWIKLKCLSFKKPNYKSGLYCTWKNSQDHTREWGNIIFPVPRNSWWKRVHQRGAGTNFSEIYLPHTGSYHGTYFLLLDVIGEDKICCLVGFSKLETRLWKYTKLWTPVRPVIRCGHSDSENAHCYQKFGFVAYTLHPADHFSYTNHCR